MPAPGGFNPNHIIQIGMRDFIQSLQYSTSLILMLGP